MAKRLIDSIEELVQTIRPPWQEQFRAFVDTGDADPAFLTYMDTDPACQEAVERAFDIKVAGLEALRDALANAGSGRDAHVIASETDGGMALVLAGVERAASLPAAEREDVFRRMAARLKQSVAPDVRKDLVASLQEK